MKLLASLLTASALLPLMWFSKVPTGQELCTSPVLFNSSVASDATDAQRMTGDEAAAQAKAGFCKTVAGFPL